MHEQTAAFVIIHARIILFFIGVCRLGLRLALFRSIVLVVFFFLVIVTIVYFFFVFFLLRIVIVGSITCAVALDLWTPSCLASSALVCLFKRLFRCAFAFAKSLFLPALEASSAAAAVAPRSRMNRTRLE